MPYLGNIPANEFSELLYQDLTGGSGTSFTLTAPVGSPQEIEVFVNNVRQEPGVAYTVSGTTLTMTGSIIASDDFYVVFQGKSVGAATHPASQALQATTGTFTGDVGVGTASPTNFGGTTLQTNHASTFTANLVSSGTHVLQMIASQTHGAMSMGARSNHHLALTTNDTERMRIDNSGKVGIGTSSPSRKLELNNGATGALVTFTDGVATNFTFKTDGSNVGTFGTEAGSTHLALMSSGTERMRINSSGDVQLGTTTNHGDNNQGGVTFQASTFDRMMVNIGHTDGSSRPVVRFFGNASESSSGNISCNGSSTAYNTSSDHRLKENVADMTGAIDRVKALAPKRFNFIADADTTVDGFLAHEAQAIVPEAVTGTKDEVDDDGNAVMQSIDQSKLVPLLTGALQEAIAKIEALEAKVAKLEGGG